MFKKNKVVNLKKNNKIFIKRILLIIILIFFIIFISFVIILNTYLNKIDIKKIDLDTDNTFSNTNAKYPYVQYEENTIKENNDIKSIALFGIDEVEGISGRSDCIMILTIDNYHSKLKLISIMRDSYVAIPTKERNDKINHAYAFGGPKLALQTLNSNFNLNLDKFISVNFSSLPKIIDDVGGITLDINNDELKYINNYIDDLNKINNTNSPNIIVSGDQIVDGTQALAYCRIRYTDGGDFERTQRHRTVINKLFEKSKTIPVTQYSSFFSEILPLLHTNLDKSEIISLTLNLNSLKNVEIIQGRFPSDDDGIGKLIDGVYYYVFNKEETNKKLHHFIYEADN